jgi:hypothetical protein
MRPLSSLLVASLALSDASRSIAQQICAPDLQLREAHISQPRSLQRTWTARLIADASQCSTTSGEFEIEFTRLKETAPDMQFIERFSWAQGKTGVSLDIWWDEWLQSYRIIRVVPCPCR